MASAFTYDNRNHRAPNPLTRTLRRVVPGVGTVAAQTAPYAAWWRERNLLALASAGPLWVVLGDSMSQGIGATAVERGWVPLTQAALPRPVRVVNLSFSGARTADVLERQLPVLDELEDAPAVVTLMVGSNDLLRRSLRRGLVERYDALLDAVPRGTLVATTPGAGRLGEVATRVDAHRGVVPVPLSFARGEVAADRFHPDDAAYRRLARTFAGPVARALARAGG